jgi:hypothetical protein
MFIKEYDKYSVITIMPNSLEISGTSQSGLVNFIPLSKAYLPYLRLLNVELNAWAKILKYDHALLQLVIYDIKSVNSNVVSDIIRDRFLDVLTAYKLQWINPYDEIDQQANWNKCETLKLEFINKMSAFYATIDSTAYIPQSLIDGLTTEQIRVAKETYSNNYVFGKLYVAAAREFRWLSYREAAASYSETIDGIEYSRSAFDIVSNPNSITPSYITFFEKESLLNENKGNIIVIRPELINDFVNTFYITLNA